MRTLDHGLDGRVVVARPDDEEGRVGAHALVLGRRELDLLHAGLLAALADHPEPALDEERTVQPAHLLVDPAEERLVLADPQGALAVVLVHGESSCSGLTSTSPSFRAVRAGNLAVLRPPYEGLPPPDAGRRFA